jgi:hypothetical protein
MRASRACSQDLIFALVGVGHFVDTNVVVRKRARPRGDLLLFDQRGLRFLENARHRCPCGSQDILAQLHGRKDEASKHRRLRGTRFHGDGKWIFQQDCERAGAQMIGSFMSERWFHAMSKYPYPGSWTTIMCLSTSVAISWRHGQIRRRGRGQLWFTQYSVSSEEGALLGGKRAAGHGLQRRRRGST